MTNFTRIFTLVMFSTTAGMYGAVINDPTGDTFGTGPVQLDLTSADVTASISSLSISLMFAAPIRAASAVVSNSLYGFIDLDVDRNAATGGGGSNQGSLGPAPAPMLNDEFFLDLG